MIRLAASPRRQHLAAAALAAAMGCIGTQAAAQAPSCHPDGRPAGAEVIFNSSGGTYGDAIQRVFFTPFERDCGVKVTHVNSQRNYAQLRQLVRSGNLAWDIGATVADQEFPLGIRDGLFHKLPAGYWDKLTADMIPGSFNEYGAWATPYSQVLVYSKDTFPDGLKGWNDFWDVARFPGPRALANNPIMLVVALIADGVAPDKVYPLDLDRAFRKLDTIRPHIRAFYRTADQGVQGVANGEFVASSTLSGRAVVAMRTSPRVGTSWNGAVLHTSWTFILKDSPRARAAEALLYYMQRPDRQAELARMTGYTGGNRRALDLLDREVIDSLPATPERIATSSVVDATWWADNNARVVQRWDAWMAQR